MVSLKEPRSGHSTSLPRYNLPAVYLLSVALQHCPMGDTMISFPP